MQKRIRKFLSVLAGTESLPDIFGHSPASNSKLRSVHLKYRNRFYTRPESDLINLRNDCLNVFPNGALPSQIKKPKQPALTIVFPYSDLLDLKAKARDMGN